jgi:hypothetical protein
MVVYLTISSLSSRAVSEPWTLAAEATHDAPDRPHRARRLDTTTNTLAE